MNYPVLEYSDNIPENLSFIKMKKDCEDKPSAYAWIVLLESEIPEIPHICIDAWILAEDELITEFEINKDWFNDLIKDELEENFVINPDINYLVKFYFDPGDKSVGIPDGFCCSIVYNNNKPITRTWSSPV